jgi:hypothetical protein
MARYTKTGTPNTIGQINAELDLIALAIDDTLSRVGDVPNQLETNLDMNSYRILNLPAPVLDNDPIRRIDVINGGDATASALLRSDLAAGTATLNDSYLEPASFASVAAMQAETNIFDNGFFISSGKTEWIVTTTVTNIALAGGKYAIANGDVFSDDFLTTQLALCINATPPNGTLRLGTKPMTGKITVLRSNISILGEKMPFYSASGNSLENGSIIKGFFIIDGDNLRLENFGVDSGLAVCTEINGGVQMEGFVCHPTVIVPVILNRNNHIKNVIGLAKSPESTVHACLIEGLEDGSADNIHGRRGQFGVVYKVVRFQIGKSTGYENGFSGVYLKSNAYAPVTSVNMNELSYYDMNAGCTNPIFIHADDAPLSDVNIGLINIDGGDNQLSLQSDATGSPDVIARLNIDKVNARLGTLFGFTTFGYNYDVTVDQLNVFDTASGTFVNTHFYSRNVNLLNINCTAITAPTTNDAVKLQGWTNYDNIKTNSFYNSDNRLNLVLNTTSLGGFKCSLGTHNAILNIDLLKANLLNSWVVRTANRRAGCNVENNRCRMFGRLNPDNAGAGKEQFFQLDSWITSNLTDTAIFRCQVAGGAVTVDGTGFVTVFVATNGAVTFPELNSNWITAGSFGGYVDLSSIEFDIRYTAS